MTLMPMYLQHFDLLKLLQTGGRCDRFITANPLFCKLVACAVLFEAVAYSLVYFFQVLVYFYMCMRGSVF